MKYDLYEVMIVDRREDAQVVGSFGSVEEAFAYVKNALINAGILRKQQMEMSYLMSKYRALKNRTEFWFGDSNHFFYVKENRNEQ